MEKTDITIFSLNTKGFNNLRKQYITEMSSFCDIMCIQEHWLLKQHLYKIENCVSNFKGHAVSGMCESSGVLQGRPHGGCAILWRDEINHNVTKLPINNERACAVRLTLGEQNMILVCVYLPTDTQTHVFNQQSIELIIADIRTLKLSYPYDEVMVTGDFNIDLSRNSPMVNFVNGEMMNMSLNSIWQYYDVDFTFQSSGADNVRSVLDHFYVSQSLVLQCTDAGVCHNVQNTSDHDLIYIKIKCNRNDKKFTNITQKEHAVWRKASEHDVNNYQNDLKTNVNNIFVPNNVMECSDCMCSNHESDIDKYCDDIMNSMLNSQSKCIPLSTGSNKKRKPGWNMYVSPLYKEAMFWHVQWVTQGRPGYGHYNLMRNQSRAEYHKAVKYINKNKELIKRVNFLDATIKGDKNLFSEIRKIKQGSKVVSNTIDGHDDNDNIAGVFAAKYNKLFNLPESDTNCHEYGALFDVINNKIKSEDAISMSQVSALDVIRAVNKMKDGKHDGIFELSTNGFKNAPCELFDHIGRLFTMCLKFGYLPAKVITCSMVPLIKDAQGNICSSDNYRAISLSTILVKIFESIILFRCYETLSTSCQQFGFKKQHSTVQCTWLVRETINYYKAKNSNIFCCLLDCTKAFDRISFQTLFVKLCTTGISGVILRFLLYMYMHQQSCVSWNGCSSVKFNVSNGVRQGSVLSPILFGFYMEDLIKKVIKSNMGCKIGNIFTGILVYADDIILLAPKRQALQHLIDTCGQYANQHNLLFSTHVDPCKSKSKCLYFTQKRSNCVDVKCLLLNGKELPWVKNAKHLGNILDTNNCNRDIDVKRGVTIGKINGVLQEFNFAHPTSRCKVLSKYCISYYGCELWDLYSEEFNKIITSWNISIRKAWDLPRSTHRRFIEPLSGFSHVKTLITSRFLKFVSNCMNHETNHILSSVARTICFNVSTVTGSNLRKIWLETGVNPHLDNLKNFKKVLKKVSYHPLPQHELYKINIIKDITDIKFGIRALDFSLADIDFMLADVCSA